MGYSNCLAQMQYDYSIITELTRHRSGLKRGHLATGELQELPSGKLSSCCGKMDLTLWFSAVQWMWKSLGPGGFTCTLTVREPRITGSRRYTATDSACLGRWRHVSTMVRGTANSGARSAVTGYGLHVAQRSTNCLPKYVPSRNNVTAPCYTEVN